MGMLDHWQPATRSCDLRQKPLGVTVAGQPLAVFRTSVGTAAAVSDICPHRRLKLSAGEVVGEQITLQIPRVDIRFVRQWRKSRCPEDDDLHNQLRCAARTRTGLGESRSSNPVFPTIDAEGYLPIGILEHTIPAPLELAVDNFNEIEHSGTVHDTFGYELTKMHEVKVRVESTEDTVTVMNSGPTKRLRWLYAMMLGIRPGDLFHDNWTTRFSPVHSVFDHWWTGADGSRERMARWRIYIFFVPQDEKTTRIFSLAYAKSRYPGPAGGLRLVKWLFRQELDKEIRADVSMLYNLADYSTGIEGLKLSRFDKVLGLTRERINRIYRGQMPGRVALA